MTSLTQLDLEVKKKIVKALTGDLGGYIQMDMEKDLTHEMCRRLGLLMEIKELTKDQILDIYEDWSALVILNFIKNVIQKNLQDISE